MDPVPGHGADDSLCLPRSARGSLILYAKRACTKKSLVAQANAGFAARNARAGTKKHRSSVAGGDFYFYFSRRVIAKLLARVADAPRRAVRGFFTDKKTPLFFAIGRGMACYGRLECTARARMPRIPLFSVTIGRLWTFYALAMKTRFLRTRRWVRKTRSNSARRCTRRVSCRGKRIWTGVVPCFQTMRANPRSWVRAASQVAAGCDTARARRNAPRTDTRDPLGPTLCAERSFIIAWALRRQRSIWKAGRGCFAYRASGAGATPPAVYAGHVR